MKLIPKKTDIDIAKSRERKMEIDEGMNLARQVDDLRRIKAEEEKHILEYRNGMMKVIRAEIDSLVEDRDNLFRANTRARLEREKLLEPLDTEWQDVNLEKESLRKEREELFISRETLKIEEKNDKKIKQSIVLLVEKSKKKEIEAQKLFAESVTFHENAKSELEKRKSERQAQNASYQKKMREMQIKEDSYLNGIKINEMDEKKLREWENDLITRESELARRTKNLQVAKSIK